MRGEKIYIIISEVMKYLSLTTKCFNRKIGIKYFIKNNKKKVIRYYHKK